MAALLDGKELDLGADLDRIRQVALARTRGLVAKGAMTETQGAKLMADFDCCFTIDRFDFAMLVQRQDAYLVMAPVF
jgi:hypothetical protein